MSCIATVTLWAKGKMVSRTGKAVLFRTPDERDMWLPVAVFKEHEEPEKSPHGTVYPSRLEVRRDFMAREWPNLLAKLEAGAPARAVVVAPRLVLAESSTVGLALDFRDALQRSRLEFDEAAAVLGLTKKQVLKLWDGYLRVESEVELQRVEAAFQVELQRQSSVTGLPVTEGLSWRKTE
ncbi:hypothetical protein D7X74_21235 [Corallococcus sp. CA047B]|uniref:hypothetical protein n=1 Tax=Corallococcus sp. CA047B TaxID=2316729 RepID=UPI000EA1A93F|nr:hypothetical protein [Corallococcus sp. CA047B]RKH13774.1 hypothetical protein D7X74_21235 [Corallococcus sp. CA047B]